MNRFRVAEERLPHFVTCSIVYWLPIFTAPRYFQIISDKRAFRVDSLRHCREHKGLRLHAFVIMPTHLHLIGSAAEDRNLADLLRDFKKFTSRKISEQLRKDNQVRAVKLTRRAARASRHEQEHKVWQDGFHPETIYSFIFRCSTICMPIRAARGSCCGRKIGCSPARELMCGGMSRC